MRARLRGLLPPHGPRYELFDCAVLLLVLGFIGYVLTDPPANTGKALEAPFLFIDQQIWGLVLSGCALFGIACSYINRDAWLLAGYRVVIWACLFWSGSFLYGMAVGNGSFRTVVSVFIYAWIARRLMREGEW